MARFALSDLVMLQLVGGLEKFISEIENGRAVDSIIDEARENSTSQGLYVKLIQQAIENQFSNETIALRELGQNALDSYDLDSKDVKIEFSYSDHTLSIRDYGIGMLPFDVIKNLLIPYNSGKEHDSDKIGEHGIGWFSILDLAEQVEVITGRGNVTRARLRRSGQDWNVDFSVKEDDFKGTQVTMELFYYPNYSKIFEGLRKQLGFVSSEFADITLEGNKINILDELYNNSSQAVIEGPSPGILTVHLDKRGIYGPNAVMTQAGLHVKDIDNPFDPATIHYDFFNKLVDYGVHFWFDIPKNIRLTKGRNNPIPEDTEKLEKALYCAFEHSMLEVVLEDEKLVRQLDHQIAEIIEKVFSEKYIKTRIDVRHRLLNFYNRTKRGIRAISFPRFVLEGPTSSNNHDSQPSHSIVEGRIRDHYLEVPKPKKSKEEVKAEEKRAKQIEELMGFSKEMMTKKFIPAMIISKSGCSFEKVSVEDLIIAYQIDSLYMHNDPNENQGVHVLSSEVVKTLVKILRQEESVLQSMIAELNVPSRGLPAPYSYSNEQTRYALIKQEVSRYFPRVGIKTFERIATKEGKGVEYVLLLRIADYLDTLVSDATRMNKGIYSLCNLSKGNIADTNKTGISFNLNSTAVSGYIHLIRERHFFEGDLDSLIEVILHEKAHAKVKNFDPHATHGNHFYYEQKKPLRDEFIPYLIASGIDPLMRINDILEASPATPPLNVNDLPELLKKHYRPF